MGLLQRFSKYHKELDALLNRVNNNAENNYKDAAQQYFKEFCNKFEELKADNKLNDKQIYYYTRMKSVYEQKLKGFHH